MVTNDIVILKEIFTLLGTGIINGYDCFKFEVEVHEDYIEHELSVILDGIKSTNIKTDYNISIMYELIEKLKLSASERGDNWNSFILSCEDGGEVKVDYKY